MDSEMDTTLNKKRAKSPCWDSPVQNLLKRFQGCEDNEKHAMWVPPCSDAVVSDDEWERYELPVVPGISSANPVDESDLMRSPLSNASSILAQCWVNLEQWSLLKDGDEVRSLDQEVQPTTQSSASAFHKVELHPSTELLDFLAIQWLQIHDQWVMDEVLKLLNPEALSCGQEGEIVADFGKLTPEATRQASLFLSEHLPDRAATPYVSDDDSADEMLSDVEDNLQDLSDDMYAMDSPSVALAEGPDSWPSPLPQTPRVWTPECEDTSLVGWVACTPTKCKELQALAQQLMDIKDQDTLGEALQLLNPEALSYDDSETITVDFQCVTPRTLVRVKLFLSRLQVNADQPVTMEQKQNLAMGLENLKDGLTLSRALGMMNPGVTSVDEDGETVVDLDLITPEAFTRVAAYLSELKAGEPQA